MLVSVDVLAQTDYWDQCLMSYLRAHAVLSEIATAVCLAVSLSLEAHFQPEQGHPYFFVLLAIGISIFVGHFSPRLVLPLLMNFKVFRRLIHGRTFVEGLWATLTVFEDGKTLPGIIRMEYGGEHHSRLDVYGWQKGKEVISSYSNNAFIDEQRHYINSFTTTEDQPRTGVAVGTFFCAHGHHPTEFHGTRFYASKDGPVKASQHALKLSSKQIKQWKDKFGDYWINAVLLDAPEALAACFVAPNPALKAGT